MRRRPDGPAPDRTGGCATSGWSTSAGALQPVFDPSPIPGLVGGAVLIALFLPIYLADVPGSRRPADPDPHRRLRRGLALAGSLVNSGASVFVIYAAATAGA